MLDPNYPAGCNWLIPPGTPDPYSIQFKAVASLGGGDLNNPRAGACPTLDLPYATPLNLVTNAEGLPTDASNAVIDRNNPTGIPRYIDEDNDGDIYDDSFLIDTRLRPLPHADASVSTNQYSVVVPAGTVGPIAVTATVYFQSFEAVVARKFLGNLANTDDLDANEGYPGGRPTLEPCVLKSACDRIGKGGVHGEAELREAMKFDPVVVEAAPALPMEVVNAVIQVTGTEDNVAPTVIINNYDAPGFTNVDGPIPAGFLNDKHWSPSPYGGPTGNFEAEGFGELNVDSFRAVKVSFSEPVQGVDANTFYLTDSKGNPVTTLQDQIDDTTWALFPFTTVDQALLDRGAYIIHVASSRNGSTITDFAGWPLVPGPDAGEYTFGFKVGANQVIPPTEGEPPPGDDTTPPTVVSVDPADGSDRANPRANVVVTFSEPVTNVTGASFTLYEDGTSGDCSTLAVPRPGTITDDGTGTVWTLDPTVSRLAGGVLHCVTVTTAVTDLASPPNAMAQEFRSSFTTR